MATIEENIIRWRNGLHIGEAEQGEIISYLKNKIEELIKQGGEK